MNPIITSAKELLASGTTTQHVAELLSSAISVFEEGGSLDVVAIFIDAAINAQGA